MSRTDIPLIQTPDGPIVLGLPRMKAGTHVQVQVLHEKPLILAVKIYDGEKKENKYVQ